MTDISLTYVPGAKRSVSTGRQSSWLRHGSRLLRSSAAILSLVTSAGPTSWAWAGENGRAANTSPAQGNETTPRSHPIEPPRALSQAKALTSSLDTSSSLWFAPPTAEDTKTAPGELVRRAEQQFRRLQQLENTSQLDGTGAMFACLARCAVALSEASSKAPRPYLSEQCRIVSIALDLVFERGRGPMAGLGYHLSALSRQHPKDPRVQELCAKYLLAQRRDLVTHAVIYQGIRGGPDSDTDADWLLAVRTESRREAIKGLQKVYDASRDNVGRATIAIYLIEAIALDAVNGRYPESVGALLKKHRNAWVCNQRLRLLARKRIGSVLAATDILSGLRIVLLDGTVLKTEDFVGAVTLLVFFPPETISDFELVRSNASKLTKGKAVVVGIPVGLGRIGPVSSKSSLVDRRKTDVTQLMKLFNVRAVPWYVVVTPQLRVIGWHTTQKASAYLLRMGKQEKLMKGARE